MEHLNGLGINGSFQDLTRAWRRHQMEPFSALLAIWVNNREAGDLKRQRDHSDVIVMGFSHCWPWKTLVRSNTCWLTRPIHGLLVKAGVGEKIKEPEST